jgi:hypothetical protein
MTAQIFRSSARTALLAIFGLVIAGNSGAATYWQNGVRDKNISVCFVGDAMSSRTARVAQIQSYLTDYGYSANIQFNYTGQCPAPSTQSNGNDYYNGDVRVVLPNTSVSFTGMVPGKGCAMFLDSKGKYNGGNDGFGSWSNAPNDLGPNRACLYNLKLGDDSDSNGVPWRNHTLHEFGHAVGLSHEHQRTDVSRRLCAANWTFWSYNTGTWPATSQALGAQTYTENEQTTILASLQKGTTDASVLLAGPLIASKLNAWYGVNSSTVSAAITAGDSLLKGYSGKLPFNVDKTSSTGAQMVTTSTQLDSAYGGSGTGFLTPYDRYSVMHYKFAACGINGNYDNTGLSDMDRLGVHILYPEDVPVAEYIGTTVVQMGEPVNLVSAWQARGANMNYVASGFQWTVNGSILSTSSTLNLVLPAGVNTFTFSHQDFLGRTYSYSGTITVLGPVDYDNSAAEIATANSSLL